MFKVQKNPGDFQIDAKRLGIPFTIQYKCPKCGTEREKDLSRDGLSYPVVDEPFDFYCYCQECGFEWVVPVKLQVTLTSA